MRLAGSTVAYKTKLQPTIAQFSTEAEFMGASDFGKILLYIQSILWDLRVSQHVALVLYEDNNMCTAMAMVQKPTLQTRHMDIKYHVIMDWVEHDLLQLKWIDTTVNQADLFTKQLGFYCHTDCVLGHVPPAYISVPTITLVATPLLTADVFLTTACLWTTIAHNPFSLES